MRSLFLSLCALILLASCEKPLLAGAAADEAQGNLTVSIFQIEQTPFASLTRAAVTDLCSRLNFAVYASDGTRVKQTNQKAGDAGFGTASFQLTEGTYQLVVVAHSSDGNPTMTDPTCIKFTNAQGYTDTFLYNTTVTIGEESESLSVSLNRIVSLCRFVITDDIPAAVKRMRFYYTGGSGAFDASTGLGCVNSKQSIFFDVADNGPKQFDLYTFLHDIEGTVHLLVSAYDANDNVLNEREFDVPMQQNQITWLTGAYFNGSGASSTTVSDITINADWAGETHINF